MAVTKTELKSSYLKDILESEETRSLVKEYTDLLSGQYKSTVQTAAQQASYDISGAYANYLSRQRNIAAQGQLETGYKEELGSQLQSAYGTAYQQAKATQAEAVAEATSAYQQYSQQFQEQIYSAAEKEATLQANIYKLAEEQAGLLDTKLGVYTAPDESGYVSLTDYGSELFKKYLLQDESFKQLLEDEGMTDELEYYLSNFQNLNEKLFGFTDTEFGVTEESRQAHRKVLAETPGYKESLTVPELDLNANDFATLDFGEKGEDKLKKTKQSVEEYIDKLYLNENEVKEALGMSLDDYYAMMNNTVSEIYRETQGKYSATYTRKELNRLFDDMIKKLQRKSGMFGE